MKKARIMILVAALLAVATILSACGRGPKELKLEKVYEQKYEAAPVFTTGAQVTGVTGDVEDDNSHNLYWLIDDSGENAVHTVYNIEAGAIAYQFTNTATQTVDDIYLHEWFGADLFVVVMKDSTDPENEVYSSVFYDGKGTAIATLENQYADASQSIDLVQFGETVYRIAADGSIAKAFDLPAINNGLPYFSYGVGDYYYYKNSKTLAIYDSNCKFVKMLSIPSYSTSANFSVLNNGNVIVSYIDCLPDNAEKYDFLIEGEKENYICYLYNVKKDKTTDLDTDYAFEIIYPRSMKDYNGYRFIDRFGFSDEVENLGAGYLLDRENKRVDMSNLNSAILSVSNDGKVVGTLSAMIDNQSPSEIVSDFADGLVSIENVVGQEFLLDTKGNLIGEITGYYYKNESFFVANDKIFDFALNELYDLTAEPSAMIWTVLDYGYIIQKAGGFFLFTGDKDAMVLIDGKDDTLELLSTNSAYYCVKDSSDALNPVYRYYNSKGTQIFESTESLSHWSNSANGNAAILYTFNAMTGNYSFYRFSVD